MDNIISKFQKQFDEIEIDHEDVSLDITHHQQHPLTYPLMCIAFEAGEVGNKFKKILRDKKGILDSNDRQVIIEELGDVLWYLTCTARLLGCSLEDIIFVLNTKLEERHGTNSQQVIQNGIPRRIVR